MELKAFDIVVAEEYYCEGIVKYRRAVYDKSESDKVIAEKDKELRHANYKRCLAMTECRDAQARLFHRFGTEVMVHQLYGMEPEVDMEQMDRRSSRCRLASQLWKKRAEKFKEAK